MKTLVTGGAGFIGTHLVRELVERGDQVVVLDSLEEQVHRGVTPDLPASVELIVGDVGDRQAADRALAGADRVVHLAAAVGVGQSMYEIARYTERNTMQTAIFLERLVAQRPPPARLVVASSMSIYGEGEYECPEHGRMAPPPRPEEQLLARQWELACPTCGAELAPVGTREDKALIPTSIYAITKRDHEELCLVAGAAYGIPAVALRFFNVYGPGQALSNPYTGVAAIFASRLLNGRPPVIFEDGEQSRDFIHVSDIVRAITLALESEWATGHAINLGTGRPSTVVQIAQALSAGLEADIEPIRNGQYRAGDIRHCVADPQRARELLGFEAATTLEDGMHALLEWLADQEAVDRVDDAARELSVHGLAR
jgi:dTDP-L-rhamnose 4-epimerase